MKFTFYLVAYLPIVFSIPVDEGSPTTAEPSPGHMDLMVNNNTNDVSPAAWCGNYTPQGCRNACHSYGYYCFCCTGSTCSCYNC
ncbi:hypothetical protein BO78DRAFT_415668 [Aspergillus sclerotiicarbonarius CBS 121057]|uniref:Invertebrate defensins family profile domain-containing protein n=1 Tax=Aspergillus sclerotiicarbonarius (strain CBS 121057 / IBT 28362) TaxID=1448318 RepID=A0A319EIA1_ASPSB|nr:hypothetical protein BO78DRAFT_415668 [Aspergillus sclerotiicarbonarius CBS 121057]